MVIKGNDVSEGYSIQKVLNKCQPLPLSRNPKTSTQKTEHRVVLPGIRESAPSFPASARTLLRDCSLSHCHVASVHKYLNNMSSDYYNI